MKKKRKNNMNSIPIQILDLESSTFDDIDAHLARVRGLQLDLDAVQLSLEPVLGARIQHLAPHPRRVRRPARRENAHPVHPRSSKNTEKMNDCVQGSEGKITSYNGKDDVGFLLKISHFKGKFDRSAQKSRKSRLIGYGDS